MSRQESILRLRNFKFIISWNIKARPQAKPSQTWTFLDIHKNTPSDLENTWVHMKGLPEIMHVHMAAVIITFYGMSNIRRRSKL